ncbi:MAG TPA: EAL domain-containing protein [Verrucomicrobiae bacterium]|nr:EAL domain-containing protein [Verrucomicrobiae bacterium]
MLDARLKILVVEDNPFDAATFVDLLKSILVDPQVSCTASVAGAVEQVKGDDCVDLIFLDLTLIDCHGMQTVRRMYSVAKTIPIIVLTGLNDDESAAMSVRFGAQDYLVKGALEPHMVLRAIRYAVERKRAETEIQRLAFFDPLTGLANRRLLSDRLEQAIHVHARRKLHFGLLFIDVDWFKQFNDLHGHDIGDLLLVEAAARFRQCIRASDTIARLGGDEFVVLVSGIGDQEHIPVVARKLLESIRAPLTVGEVTVRSTVSMGAAVFPADGSDEKTLLRHAEIAMYKAKEIGRDAFRFFNREMNHKVQQRSEAVAVLRTAIDNGEFFLRFQPQISLRDGSIRGLEALVRWRHPTEGETPPGAFIPLAEETGLIGKLGEWVLREACRRACSWSSCGLPAVRTGVNISARQFMDDSFVPLVRSVLDETGLDPRLLELELTESVLMAHTDRAVQVLKRLRDMGISLALDDFGTGYSSLNYLNLFPIDRLKIDRSFIRTICDRNGHAPIPRAVIGLAHTLGLSVVAEGVETPAQLAFLRDHDCDEAQGYLLGSPQTVEELMAGELTATAGDVQR